jgi:hypothetical protein
MNERIKELMPKPWTFPYPDRELYTKEQFEKFAEDMVRKCSLYLWKNEIEWTAFKEDRLFEHFGIK